MLFHRDLGFPRDYPLPFGIYYPAYSDHSLREAKKDKYGPIHLPEKIYICKDDIVEIEIAGNQVTKILIRQLYSEHLDICMVLLPLTGFVKTVWLNTRDDTHLSLNRNRYSI